MNPLPPVTIIVLVWNNLVDTLACLNSLQKIDYPNFQVLLVDNGSTDNTVPAVREQFPSVQIIQNGRNLGYAEGNNIGIRYALKHGAEYVLILNNDVVADSQLLQILVAAAQRHPETGILAPKIYFYDQPNKIWFAGARWNSSVFIFDYLHWGEEDSNPDPSEFETEVASGCAMFMRASVVREVGLFDPRFFLTWEETDWCCRSRRKGYKILVVPTAKVWHKVSRSFGDGEAGGTYAYYFTRNWLLFAQKNLSVTQQVALARRAFRIARQYAMARRHREILPEARTAQRARLLGVYHFLTRRFGELAEKDRVKVLGQELKRDY